MEVNDARQVRTQACMHLLSREWYAKAIFAIKKRARCMLGSLGFTNLLGLTDLRSFEMHLPRICSPSGKNNAFQPMRRFRIDFGLHAKSITIHMDCNQTIWRDLQIGKKRIAIRCLLALLGYSTSF